MRVTARMYGNPAASASRQIEHQRITMYVTIAMNIYRTWSAWDCGTETALRALHSFEREAWEAGDVFACTLITAIRAEVRKIGYAMEAVR